MKFAEEKIKSFREGILTWYEENGRDFSWREPRLSNYQKLVVEVLLQRTKAETIEKFLPNFLEKFPSWNSIVDAEIQGLEESLKPIGLYKQRARRLHCLAKEMVESQKTTTNCLRCR